MYNIIASLAKDLDTYCKSTPTFPHPSLPGVYISSVTVYNTHWHNGNFRVLSVHKGNVWANLTL